MIQETEVTYCKLQMLLLKPFPEYILENLHRHTLIGRNFYLACNYYQYMIKSIVFTLYASLYVLLAVSVRLTFCNRTILGLYRLSTPEIVNMEPKNIFNYSICMSDKLK